MDIKQAIHSSLAQSDFVVNAYISDLKPADFLARPVPGVNHLAWQLGHLIAAERYMLDKAAPGMAEPLPEGFNERHSKETAAIDRADDFLSKDEYLRLAKQVRSETLRIVDRFAPSDFDKPAQKGVPPFIKTAGEALLFIGGHWLMHAGQWAVLRRKLGHAPLF